MSSIPSNLARVPNLLASQVALRNITRSSLGLFGVQEQISTGFAVNRTSDDVAKSAILGVLDDRLERATQIDRNLSHAESSLNVLDDALGAAADLGHQAKDIAQTQMNFGTTSSERAAQAVVVDQLIRSLYETTNRQSPTGYMFGGSVTSQNAIVEFAGGYRYMGAGPGLVTDTGPAAGVPVTLAADNVLGSTASRVRGSVDLNPSLTAGTRLADLSGARGLGVSLGRVQFSFDGGTPVEVDLTQADTAQNVADALTAAIKSEETRTGRTILGPGGVSFSGGSIAIDVAGGTPNPELEFFEVGSGVTARDLGLAADTPFTFSATATTGVDVSPKLSWRSPVSSLTGVTGALGDIRIRNMGRAAVIDLSGAETLEDVRNLIENAQVGCRVAINADGTGIDILNEVAAGSRGAMSIEEVAGNNSTATRLGIRSLSEDTLITDFNDARGVRIIDGSRDPITGLPAPEKDIDFAITLGDAASTVITIDLRPQDMLTVRTLTDRINSEAATQLAAAGLPTDSLVAGLPTDGNGIVLRQSATFAGPVRVETRNNSPAAEQLGLLGGNYDATSSSFRGGDRAKVRVDNMFTHLIDLREALLANDATGIGIAGGSIETSVDRLAEARGLVGGFAQRVETAIVHHEDQKTIDLKIQSDLRDTDYAAAAVRLSQMQNQLQAGLQVTAATSSMTLLNFL